MQIQGRVGKHVTGHVGLGKNMRIDELINLEKFEKMDFDLNDDLIYFMNNDPKVYRQLYYPTVVDFMKSHKTGSEFDAKQLVPLVIKSYKLYKQKFPIDKLPEKLKRTDVDDICGKIYETELSNIKTGHYDGKK